MDYMPLFTAMTDDDKMQVLASGEYQPMAEVKTASYSFMLCLRSDGKALITYYANGDFAGTHYVMTNETSGTHYTPYYGASAWDQFAKIVTAHFSD